MAGVLQHLRSSTLNKRPNPASMVDGQLAINYASGSPGAFFKDSNGNLVKVGPVHVGATAPNVSPASGGTAGNSLGEQWLDTSGGTYVFKIWDGAAWRSEAGEFVNITGDTMTGALGIVAGDASTPGLFFSGDANSGLYSPGADQVAISTGGSGRLFVDANGNTLVGANANSGGLGERLSINGTGLVTQSAAATNRGLFGTFGGSTQVIGAFDNIPLEFRTNNIERLRVTSAGRVGIGTTSPGKNIEIASTTASVQSQLYWNANNSDAGDVERGAYLFSTNRSNGTQRSWGIYGHTNSLDTTFNSSLIFKTVTSGTESEKVRIDNGGRLLVGTSSARANFFNTTASAGIQLEAAGDTSAINRRLSVVYGDSDVYGPYIILGKHRSNSIGGNTVVQSGDEMGGLTFQGSDGSEFVEAARIQAFVDGTPGANDMPGRLVFSTTADGASSPTARATIDSSGRLLVGTSSSSADTLFRVQGKQSSSASNGVVQIARGQTNPASDNGLGTVQFTDAAGSVGASITAETELNWAASDYPSRLIFATTADNASSPTRRMSIKQDGSLVFGDFDAATSTASGGKAYIDSSSTLYVAVGGGTVAYFNRNTDDGEIVALRQANVTEGSISVSGTTVTYGGGHLARWSQLPNNEDPSTLLKGTVMSNLDDMCQWEGEDNEQLNRTKVSDVEGDPNVAGVFVSTSFSEDGPLDFFVGMTGDMVIRIGAGVTVERGDLLMSAGDGTAKPQDDDIIRSKTIAKVTSTNVSCTYDDGSYCVPCVLMAC